MSNTQEANDERAAAKAITVAAASFFDDEGSIFEDETAPELAADGDASSDEEDTAELDLDSALSPSAVDTSDEVDTEDEDCQTGVFTIYHAKCLKCSHLFAEAERAFNNCHFTNGNDECPAKDAVIVVGIPTQKVVTRVLEAEAEANTLKLAQIYMKLASKSKPVQMQFAQALAEARAAQG